MLDFIRKGASSWMIKFLLGAIVIVFIFWGVGSFRSQRMDVIATVNGQKILSEDYKIEYNRTLDRYSKMFGGSIPDGLMKQLNLKQQVLDSLINKTIIAQEAEKMGIRVSDQEVQQAILSIPAFQVQGVFDKRAYLAALRNARLTPEGFESQIRESLLMEELKALLGAGITVPEAEAREHYLYENQEINIAFIKIDSDECRDDVKYTDEDLREWFDAHSENYRTEPRIEISYLLFDTAGLAQSANVTEEELKDWYDLHQSDYHKPEERKARHILLKLPQDATPQEIEAKKKQIEELRARAEEGKDFAELAKKYSEDPGSRANGGDLGFFPRNAMVKPFADAAFSMKKGEISQPVRTRFGWHIIQLEDIKPEATIPFQVVKNEIRKKIARQKAKKMAWNKANQAYDEIIQMGSLDEYAKATGITLKKSGMFSRKNPPPVLGGNPEILSGLFSLSQGELSSLLDVPTGVLIAEVTNKDAPHIPEFKEVKEKVTKDYVAAQAKELCRQKAEALLAKVKEKGPEAACANGTCTVEETGFFKRSAPSANGKLPPLVVKSTLSLYKGKVYSDKVEENGNSFFILAFKEAKEADMKGFPQEKSQIVDKLMKEKEQTIFKDWLKHAREKAELKVSRNL